MQQIVHAVLLLPFFCKNAIFSRYFNDYIQRHCGFSLYIVKPVRYQNLSHKHEICNHKMMLTYYIKL